MYLMKDTEKIVHIRAV